MTFAPESLALIGAGAGVGWLVGCSGVGGGAVMTPLLYLGFGMPLPLAIGTDLWFAAVTKSSATFSYIRAGMVDWRIARRLATGSLPAALACAAALRALQPDPGSLQSVLELALGMVLVLSALLIGLRVLGLLATSAAALPAVPRTSPQLPDSAATLVPAAPARTHPVPLVAAGSLVGTAVMLTSVGAGALGTAAIALLHPRLSARRLVASELAHATLLAGLGGLLYSAIGLVDWATLALLLAGSLPGSWAGTRMARRLPDRWLRSGIALLLAAAAMHLLLPASVGH